MKYVFLFPGQGAQYPGMGKDFVESYATAKQTLEEADDILGRKLSSIILNGPENILTETKNSQTGIYTISIAIMAVLQELFSNLKPSVCAGLSLGEYTALTAAGYLGFAECLPLVQHRGQYMNDACEATEGTMAVILGMEANEVEDLVKEVNMPNDLWAANFNCPGQVVISGTVRGIKAGSEAAKAKGAKRVLPLQVHGAFHSGLMQQAEERLAEHIHQASIKESTIDLVMNVTGKPKTGLGEIKENLIKQVTSPVRWEQGIHSMEEMGIDLFVEIGCGKTLAGFNKRIGVVVPTVSVEKVEDLKELEKYIC